MTNKIQIREEEVTEQDNSNFLKMASSCILNNICDIHQSDKTKNKNILIYNEHIYYNFGVENNKTFFDVYFLMFACNFLQRKYKKDYTEVLSKVLNDNVRSFDYD